jgi:hypothetical protein
VAGFFIERAIVRIFSEKVWLMYGTLQVDVRQKLQMASYRQEF